MQLTLPETIFGRSESCDLVLAMAELSREHAKFVRAGRLPVRIVDLDSTNGVYVNGVRVHQQILGEGDLIGLEGIPLLQFRYHAFHDVERARRLYERSAGDPISGAFNKRYLLDRVIEEIALCRRQDLKCCLLALRPEGRVNENLLRSLAERLEGGLPTEDLLARWEKETFVALLRGKVLSEAFQFAQKLCRLVSDIPFPATSLRPRPVQLTLRGGVVELRDESDPEKFVERALKTLGKAARGKVLKGTRY